MKTEKILVLEHKDLESDHGTWATLPEESLLTIGEHSKLIRGHTHKTDG